jgi:hypothetical protein
MDGGAFNAAAIPVLGAHSGRPERTGATAARTPQ